MQSNLSKAPIKKAVSKVISVKVKKYNIINNESIKVFTKVFKLPSRAIFGFMMLVIIIKKIVNVRKNPPSIGFFGYINSDISYAKNQPAIKEITNEKKIIYFKIFFISLLEV